MKPKADLGLYASMAVILLCVAVWIAIIGWAFTLGPYVAASGTAVSIGGWYLVGRTIRDIYREQR